MRYVLENLEPQNVFKNFYDLSQIYSRRSDNTKGISDWLADYGRKLGLEVYQDDTDNVIIYKPAYPGYEDAPSVMLAGHMDMICATDPGVVHDFDNEPLEIMLSEDGNVIYANGTTLGADCGIGLAFMLAVLESDNIPHPAIEAVFTTNEETDMIGAQNLDYSRIKSRIILSTDAIRLSMGGAGELEMEMFVEQTKEPVDPADVQTKISISGLMGGHSGKNAFAERGNAVTLLVRVLSDIQRNKNIPFRLASFTGGDTTACAFARNAECVISYPAEMKNDVMAAVEEWNERYKTELKVPDPAVELTACDAQVSEVCDAATTEKFITLITIHPDGLCSLHKYFEHKYETTVNVGVVEMEENRFRIISCIRSAVASKKYHQFDKIVKLCNLMNVEYGILHDLPEWAYVNDSRLYELVCGIYSDMEPNVAQGTCEQGIFLMNMPGAEAAGIGPVVNNPHSPREYIEADVIADDWNRFLKVLRAMKEY